MADSRSSKKRDTNKKVIEKINLFLKKQKKWHNS